MPGGTTLIGTAVAALGLALSVWAAAHAVLHKRKPQSAFAWIAIAFAVPFLGVLLYYTFGINRVRTRAKRLWHQPEWPYATSHSAGAPAGLEPLAELGLAVTKLPLVSGNAVDVLHNGDHAFPAMLAAIRSARRRVFLSTYIFDSGPVGQEFAAALGDAVAREVDVRVAIDGVGALYSWPRAHSMLERRGVRVARFLPPRLVPPSFSVNLRNHRKILAVDGQIAFTGGVNIREHYLVAEAERSKRVVDLHFRLAGPVVVQIEAVFLRDWQFMTGETDAVSRTGDEAFGSAVCRAVADGPEEDMDRLTELLVGAIGKARERIAIMTPYFIPSRELIAPLAAAALQGLDVAVILPARNNLPYVHRATRHMLWELLQRDVRVYYQPAPFVHSKLFYTDSHYAQIGSANLDPRSLRLNFEMNVEIYDESFVAKLSAHFEEVRARSLPVTLADVDGRPLTTKLLDGAAWLFAPYL